MNDLNKALGDISSIRRQVARSTEFRGYGPATLAATGGIAMLAAGVQAVWLPNPANRIPVYLAIWLSTAIVSAALIAVQTVTRSHRMHSGMADEMIRMAVEQFLPAAGAGALLTLFLWVLFRRLFGCFQDFGRSHSVSVYFRRAGFFPVRWPLRAHGIC